MAKLSDFIAHDLITTASGKLLGAEQAQYLAPKESPIFSGNVKIITPNDSGGYFSIGDAGNNSGVVITSSSDNGESCEITGNGELIINARDLIIENPTFTGGIITDGFSGNFRYHSDLNPDILLTDYLVAGTDNPSDPAILPKASTCKGKVIVLLCSVDDIGFTVSSFSGDSIILSNSGGPATTITITTPYNSKTLISDGAATWYQIQ
jgi:hypothetical protein